MELPFNKLNKFWWLPVIILLIIINLFSAYFHKRIDLTNEKRFTLSSPVKKLLNNIDSTVRIDIFLKGELPSAFQGIASYTDDLLREFKEIGKNKIQYNFINPSEEIPGSDRTYVDTLRSMGFSGINLTIQLKAGEESHFIYPVVLVYYKNKVLPVILYEGNKSALEYKQFYEEINSAEALLEYNFANAIEKLTQQVKPMVAYSTGNGEPTGTNTYDLVENILKKNYNLFTVNINLQPVIPDTFKLLLIVKPTRPFTESEKIKIDQYIMRGGKVMWCIDRLEAEMDSLRLKNQVVAYDRNLNLEDLLFKYGVRINPDLIMDLQCDFLPFDVNGNGQFEFLHWNYFPLFQSNSNHAINKNIGLVAARFVNSIDTVKANNISKTILLSSSPNSKVISAPALISGEENRNAPEDEQFKNSNIPVAVLLEGKFNSLYANRMTASAIDSMEKYGTSFQTSCINTNKMIVISDGDIVLNGVSQGNPLPMGVNPFTVGSQYQYKFANKDFIQNCIEYLINNSGLSEAKAKDYTLRLLDPKKINDHRTMWQLVNILFPIVLVILFGLIYQFWRKRKYSR